jgi:hypothetical protein
METATRRNAPAGNVTIVTKGIARVSHSGGATLLPARSPYERELLLQYLTRAGRRYLALRLDLDGETWSLTFDRRERVLRLKVAAARQDLRPGSE